MNKTSKTAVVNGLAINKEATNALSEALIAHAAKLAPAFEAEIDADFDAKSGYMEFTITFTNTEYTQLIEKFKANLAKKLARGEPLTEVPAKTRKQCPRKCRS
jgi:hypothetical protein